QKPEQFFRAAFKKLIATDAQELIIDVRDNGGGSEEAFIPLLQHLLTEPFQVYRELSVKTQTIPQQEYFPYDKPKKLEKAAKKSYTAVGDRFHDLNSPSVKMTAPNSPHYQGKVYVLMNERSYSATGDFIGVLDQYNRATFAGVETGGNPYQNVAGERLTLLLPNSQLRIHIPLLKYVINNDHKNEGRGMLPDISIPQTVDEIINFQDLQLEKLLERIRR
ncbi:MAG: S41 family peptidase, partial [Bacteroidota bacterium]